MSAIRGLSKVVLDGGDDGLQTHVVLEPAMRRRHGVQNGRVIPSKQLADVRKRCVQEVPAEVHGHLPRSGDVLAPSS